MKRACLQLIAGWREIQTFFSEVHAQSALQTMQDADEELDRAHRWLNVRGAELKAAQVRRNLALLAIERHERQRAMGRIFLP